MGTTCRRRLALALIWAALLAAWPPPARAQEADNGANAAGGAAKVVARETFLPRMARASGMLGIVLLTMSFYLIALIAWMAFEYRRSVALPPKLVDDLAEHLAAKRYTEAYQRAAGDPSFLARVVTAGVKKLPNGIGPGQKAADLSNEEITMGMEHRTTYLATVGTLGPMIGLVGTVYGMIESFRVIETAGASPQASQIAGGISTALFATLEGIAIAIPAIYFHAVFRNRIARLSLEVAMSAESLLEAFAPGVRSPHPLASAAVGQRSIGGPNT